MSSTPLPREPAGVTVTAGGKSILHLVGRWWPRQLGAHNHLPPGGLGHLVRRQLALKRLGDKGESLSPRQGTFPTPSLKDSLQRVLFSSSIQAPSTHPEKPSMVEKSTH